MKKLGAIAKYTKWAIKSAIDKRTDPRIHMDFIFQFTIANGSSKPLPVSYPVNLNKEAISREFIFRDVGNIEKKRRFLDVGGRDGELAYLFGATGPLSFSQQQAAQYKEKFHSLYEYYCVDLKPAGPSVLHGDMCSTDFLNDYADKIGTFDVIYSNNVLEHFERPWIAAANMLALLKVGGICITIVPFSQRYHEDPGDYFRYTHTGVTKLFEAAGSVKVLKAGYDIWARRYNWQGSGTNNDIVPVDRFGAWRETWLTVSVLEKSA